MKDLEVYMLKVVNMYFNTLLYADDITLLTYSQVGLCCLLSRFGFYCRGNSLINKLKSKVPVFRKRHNKHR